MKHVILVLFVAGCVPLAIAQSFDQIMDEYADVQVLILASSIDIYEGTDTGGPVSFTAQEDDTLYVYRPTGSFVRAASRARGFLGYIVQTDINLWLIRFEPSDFAFYTGVAYLSRVRFADGEIWEADIALVVDAILAIDETFEASRISR